MEHLMNWAFYGKVQNTVFRLPHNIFLLREACMLEEIYNMHQCCGSRMFIPDPGSELSPYGSRIRICIKEFKYFNPKKGFQALENMIRIVYPESRIRMLTITHPGSRIQGSKWHRIQDPDPQH
jgi:hypothetical protein